MLHVFHVDLGVLYTFEMELAMESVQVLMTTVASMTGIPEDKQVLLISSGEALDPAERVYSYTSAGTFNLKNTTLGQSIIPELISTVNSLTATSSHKQPPPVSNHFDTNPIFLFSKSTIESSIPPSPSLNLGSEANLKEQVEKSLNLPPTYETLVSRAQLASDFHALAVEVAESCENLVMEQKLQQKGWTAVVANLESIASEFKARANGVHQIYTEFLDAKPRYLELLEGFKQILPLLSRVPVLPSLLTRQQLTVRKQTDRVSLLDWISAQDNKYRLQDIAKQCVEAVDQFDESHLKEITNEVNQVLESLDHTNMKEIKGLDDRLTGLQQLLQNVQTLMQSQADMAQGFQQNQERAQNIGDASVLPPLCASHQKQLMMLRKNHTHLRDMRKMFAKAKDELSVNLHTRLRWIMYVEKKICDCDGTIIMYHENIRRIKRRLEIIEQVNEAPRLYILAVAEVVRRRTFSLQFQKWASRLCENSVQARADEIARREEFELHFGQHFLQNLFGGLADRPSRFADKPPKTFDELLPIITERDLQELQEQIPELMSYLESIPINISMKDETGKISVLQSDELENLSAAQFQLGLFQSRTSESMTDRKGSSLPEMTASANKATQMSMDVSTQVEWTEEGLQSSSIEQNLPLQKEIEVGIPSTQNLTENKGLTELVSEVADENTAETTDKNDTHERKKSNSDSASEGSDLVFRSAHEDYVTVLEADLAGNPDLDLPSVGQPVAEYQEHCASLLDEASQTPTLTSSGTQSTNQSTQREDSFEEHWHVQSSCSQDLTTQTMLDSEGNTSPSDKTRQSSIDEMVEKLNELEVRLSSTREALDITTAQKDQLQKASRNLRDCLRSELEVFRSCLSENRHLVSEWGGQMKEDILGAVDRVQQIQKNHQEDIVQSITQRTREEFKNELSRLNLEFEQQKSAFLEVQSKLEREKNELMEELQQVQNDKETSEIRHHEESAKLNSLLGDYKAKLDEQQGPAQKLQENRSRYEEDQQIRFNAIIMKLKREKEQAVMQAQERIRDLNTSIVKQEENMKMLMMEKEKVVQEREVDRNVFCQREQELLAAVQDKEAKLQEAERVMHNKQVEFQEQLEKEKASALMLLRVEKQMWEAGRKKQESVALKDTQCVTDSALEEDFQQKIILLEEENRKLREGWKQTQMQQISSAATAAVSSKTEKISLRDFQIGDLILLMFEERYENYIVLSTGQTLFFLHPDSLTSLDLATSGPKKRPWMIAQMTDKEYCQAKKPHNRFHVPMGTKFYRIQAKPWER